VANSLLVFLQDSWLTCTCVSKLAQMHKHTHTHTHTHTNTHTHTHIHIHTHLNTHLHTTHNTQIHSQNTEQDWPVISKSKPQSRSNILKRLILLTLIISMIARTRTVLQYNLSFLQIT